MLDRYIAQSANGGIPLWRSNALLLRTLHGAVVGARSEIVLHLRVADHQADARRNRNELVLERTAIEKKCVTGFAHAGNELVHDADAGADEFVLRLAAQFGDFRQRQLCVARDS